MLVLRCPVCKKPLYTSGLSLECQNHHTFDISKYRYVNLAMDNRSSKKHHGDDKLMVRSRTDFLNSGYYEPLQKQIVQTARGYLYPESNVVDAGCGEGYYTDALQKEIGCQVLGVDLSKEALRAAGKRNQNLLLAVAGASSVPVPDQSIHMVLSIFAPCFPEEFSRILMSDGILIRAAPTEDHLWGLKKSVYDEPYKNPSPETELEHFRFLYSSILSYSITLDSNEMIQDLFRMTPYYYKTGKKDQDKLEQLDHLTTEVGFAVQVFRKE